MLDTAKQTVNHLSPPCPTGPPANTLNLNGCQLKGGTIIIGIDEQIIIGGGTIAIGIGKQITDQRLLDTNI